MFRGILRDAFQGDHNWSTLAVPEGQIYHWDEQSTYIKKPPYFDKMLPLTDDRSADLFGMRVLALLGDSVTTDHISPAGIIAKDSRRQVFDLARREAGGLQLLRRTPRQP